MPDNKFSNYHLMVSFVKDPRRLKNIVRRANNLSIMHNYNDIKENLEMKFGNNVSVHFYGSRVQGFAHKKSDIDIFIEFSE